MPTFEPLTALRAKLNSTTGSFEDLVDQNGASAIPPLSARLVRPAVARNKPMVSVFSGNSIGAFAVWGGTGANAGYPHISAYGYAQQLSGLRMIQQSKATAGTYTDACGNYGHASFTLTQILGELQSVHFAALDAAGIVPDLWIALAMHENSIATASTDTSAAELLLVDQYVKAVRTKYPGIVFIWCTPRPDGRVTTAARKTMRDNVYAGIMAREDNYSFLACDLTTGTYVSADGYTPLAGYTFTTNTSDALTDVGNVHERQNAACINGRRIAASVARLCDEPVIAGLRLQSNNDSLFGTGAYATLKTTGTMPTNTVVTVAPSGTNATIIATALQPGLNLVFTPDAGTLNDVVQINLAALTLSPEPMRFQVFARVKINSGASRLSSITARAVVTYSSGNSTHLTNNSASVSDPTVQPCVYQDGDDLVLVSPEYDFTKGVTVTNLTSYIRAYYYSASGQTPLDMTITAIGILPVGRSTLGVIPGASPYSYTATAPGRMVITGGTVSAVDLTRNGLTFISIASATGVTVQLDRGDVLRTTYTVAPTMTFIADNPA
jgi:hypothetical protein